MGYTYHSSAKLQRQRLYLLRLLSRIDHRLLHSRNRSVGIAQQPAIDQVEPVDFEGIDKREKYFQTRPLQLPGARAVKYLGSAA